MKYLWSELKNKANIKKHKISFEEAQTVLQAGDYLAVIDTSSDEERFKAIGFSMKKNLLVVIYMYREEDIIRIISVRKTKKSEEKAWQKENY
jgi:uncharacterized protein